MPSDNSIKLHKNNNYIKKLIKKKKDKRLSKTGFFYETIMVFSVHSLKNIYNSYLNRKLILNSKLVQSLRRKLLRDSDKRTCYNRFVFKISVYK
jgi:hypothetical protein